MTFSGKSRLHHFLVRLSIHGIAGIFTLVFVLGAIVVSPRNEGARPAEAVATAPSVAMAALDATEPIATSVPAMLPTTESIATSVPQMPSTGEVDASTPIAVPPTETASEMLAMAPERDFITHLAPGEGVGANEAGRIPILMYHAFVFDEKNTDDWTLTFDQYREQLGWLVANDYVMVGLTSIINRDFDVPAGKKPVVLTFDDASGGQFRLQPSADGGIEVNPDTAVGILEEYKRAHPEFAGPAFFAVLPDWCFAYPDDNDPSTCEERLRWLVDHGYEVGNHTMEHMNLTHASRDDVMYQVHGPKRWLDGCIPGPNNLADVLVLPYGAYPAQDDLRAMLFNGFKVEGELFVPSLILEVGASPARSPFHIEWTRNLSRYNTKPEIFWQWAESMDSGKTVVFVSDGDPGTVTVPEGWEATLNQELIAEDGRRVVIETSGAFTG